MIYEVGGDRGLLIMISKPAVLIRKIFGVFNNFHNKNEIYVAKNQKNKREHSWKFN